MAGFADATGRYLPLVCTMNATKVTDAVARLLGLDRDRFDGWPWKPRPAPVASYWCPTSTASGLRTDPTRQACSADCGATSPRRSWPALRSRAWCATSSPGPKLSDPLPAGCSSSAARPAAAPTAACVTDIIGRPVVVPTECELVATGAAVQAAAIHLDHDFTRVGEAWGLGRGDVVEPDGSVDGVAVRAGIRSRRRQGRTVTFSNPVIPGFHPDPSVCRVGEEYFLVTSSFTYSPGVPIFRSRNLVDWTQIGNVLERPSQLDLSGTTASASLGIYAPTIRHHDGRFWAITTCVRSPGLNSFFVTSADPAGPWSDPIGVAVQGIDPDLAWDGEGRCWVHFSSLAGVARCRIDSSTGDVVEGPEPTWSGTGLQYPEAPHLLERDGTWYLLIAEGGTERGHAVSVARGPSPEGPWEGCPQQPDSQPPQHRQPDSEHRARRPRRGDRRNLVDGAVGGPPEGALARVPRARPRDVPHRGGMGRRLAGSRRGRR